jgi:hypothetical protein
MARPKNPDFRVSDHGTVVSFQAVTAEAIGYLEETLKPCLEGWQWLGQTVFAVDHRCCEGLIHDIMGDGYTVAAA